MARTLVHQSPAVLDEGMKWSLDQKPYLNVRNVWELEVRDHGFLAYRWGEWTHGTDRWCGILPFVDGVVLPISLHQSVLRLIATKLPASGTTTRFMGRLSAHGDGPLKLNDNGPLTIPSRRISAPESAADWMVESEGDHSVHPIENGTRLLNRALAKFTFTTVDQYFGQANDSRFLRMDEAKLRSIYGHL